MSLTAEHFWQAVKTLIRALEADTLRTPLSTDDRRTAFRLPAGNSYPCTRLETPRRIQEAEVPKIFRQTAHEVAK